jgi:hypothetical protein
MEAIVPTVEELSLYFALFTELSIDNLISIQGIAKDRIACICKMDSDLMHSSCTDFYFYERYGS